MLEKGGPQAAQAEAELYGGPELPEVLAYLWVWFLELDQTRQVTMAGLAALTYTDIKSWAELTGRKPQPHEVDALMKMDGTLRLAVQVEGKK